MRLLTLPLALSLGVAACHADPPRTVSVGGDEDAGRPREGAPAPRTDAGNVERDAGAPPVAPLMPTEHDADENASCYSQLMAAWAENPPRLGRGTPTAVSSYDALILAAMKKYQVPGGAVAVTHSGKLVFARGFGWADREALAPAHPDDLFRLASLSKQLTAAAIMLLVQDGKLSLDDAAFDKLGSVDSLPGTTRNPKLAQIKVRDLLQHRGGWNRDAEAAGDPLFRSQTIAKALGEPGPASSRDVIRYMLDKPLSYEPGTTYCYSNLGYVILSEIVAQVSGDAYDAYVQEHVLRPRGVFDAALGHTLEANTSAREVRYYDSPNAQPVSSVFPDVKDKVPFPYGGFHLEALAGAGAWILSPIDMVRFELGIDGLSPPDDLITPQGLKAMLANPSVPTCTESGGTNPVNASSWYGFGLSVNTVGNYWHFGSLPGTTTEDVVAPREAATWAAFFNMRSQDRSQFENELDTQLWPAFRNASPWTTQDFFDQYTAFGAWLDADAFEQRVADAAASGEYAARVEGRVEEGALQYRAQFAPQHGRKVVSAYGFDCVSYRERAEQETAAGHTLAALQHFSDAAGVERFQACWAADPGR